VKISDGVSFVCCQISSAAFRSLSCCVRLIFSAAATMSGMGSQASDASVFVSREQGSPDSLELMVGNKCALTEIADLPGEAENLALAKTEDQNQDVGGVQRISGGAGGLEKAPGLVICPGQDLSLALLGNLYELSNIAVDQFLTDCRVQR
jgi:hypothetical protein